ncbi:DUF1127 domain-containing protein [Pseudoroseicyclus sp. CXY001]|uniref:DUF1127 domain-containing protein n=1 Tax=Pseudoroseicyclus sp. CXY001 TaxID=3242492 RepID=UPI00358DC50A
MPHGSIAEPAIVHLQQMDQISVQDDRSGRRRAKSPVNRSDVTRVTRADEFDMALATSSRLAGFTIGQRFLSGFAFMGERAAQARVYRSTVKELSSLGDRDLADLGLHRSMIKAVARTAAYGE